MDKKLTLSLNAGIIENAKLYAKSDNVSLSKLIESYLKSIMHLKAKDSEITPLVASLSGVINLEPYFDYKEAYDFHLMEKYT